MCILRNCSGRFQVPWRRFPSRRSIYPAFQNIRGANTTMPKTECLGHDVKTCELRRTVRATLVSIYVSPCRDGAGDAMFAAPVAASSDPESWRYLRGPGQSCNAISPLRGEIAGDFVE